MTGKIVERTYLGQHIQYWIETPIGRQQVVEMNPHVIYAAGEAEILLHARNEDVVVVRS
jgi:hypothetical protein